MKPSEVTAKDEDKIWLNLYGKNRVSPLGKSRLGEKVRINKIKGVFAKGYVPNWSEEHFQVKKEITKKRPVYRLADDLGEDIKGEFYNEELQAIDENRYLIERFLKKKKDPTGNFLYFVKWKGWPSKFNSWIPAKQYKKIIKLKK